MIRINLIRAVLLGLATVPCAFAVEKTPISSLSFEPVALASVQSFQPGTLTRSSQCGDPFSGEDGGCVAVPVAVTGVDETGEIKTVMTAYPVGPDLVGKVQSDFHDAATVVLRQIRPALQTGVASKDPELKTTCKQALAEVNDSVHYRVNPGIQLPLKVETTVAKIADRSHEMGTRPIVVTSGSRTAKSQADAMRTKIAMGDNVVRLYANKKAAASVLHAYKEAKHTGAGAQQVTEHMAKVIQAQMDKGVFLSRHLREGAVDLRVKDLSAAERADLVAAVQETPGVHKMIMESIPPHLHVEIE